ncbi:hypothetical protein [Streptomyces sp. NPDC018833]|uniref:hypothetical protein n=1 Tax=Streptomyces sp. NPDC018833 TaxID=3365053 RepID=UPI00379CA737
MALLGHTAHAFAVRRPRGLVSAVRTAVDPPPAASEPLNRFGELVDAKDSWGPLRYRW